MSDSSISSPRTNRGTLIVIMFAIAVISAIVLAYMTVKNSEPLTYVDWQPCIKERAPSGTITLENAAVMDHAELACYHMIRHQLLLNDFKIRRDAYSIQPFETKVLMWMVVLLVAGGVALAWYQVWAAYELAGKGKEFNPTGQAGGSVEMTGFVVKSSIVGVAILAISFAFFGVYVKYVYIIDDSSTKLQSEEITVTGQGTTDSKPTPAPEPTTGTPAKTP